MAKVTTKKNYCGKAEGAEGLLPGFRFHPTDEELVGFYLRRKAEKKPISIDIIKQVEIYKYDPWDLPRGSNVGDKEWYFFCQRGRKYRNSERPNRVTGSGFWKATGIDRPIFCNPEGSKCIGLKKSLVYYRGSAGKGTKTDWMMHEFRLPPTAGNHGDIHEAETWTICRIFKRAIPHIKRMPRGGVPSDSNAKTGSVESKHSVNTYVEHTESNNLIIKSCEDTKSNNSVITFLAGESQLRAGQWNPSAQAPPVPSDANISIFDEGSWDELGRIVEIAVDPSLAYECTYS